jgi:hypothetical protein
MGFRGGGGVLLAFGRSMRLIEGLDPIEEEGDRDQGGRERCLKCGRGIRNGRTDQKGLGIGDWRSTMMTVRLEIGGGLI